MRRVKKSTREVKKRDTQGKKRGGVNLLRARSNGCPAASTLMSWGGAWASCGKGLSFPLGGGDLTPTLAISGGWAIILFDRHAGVIAGILRHMRVTLR